MHADYSGEMFSAGAHPDKVLSDGARPDKVLSDGSRPDTARSDGAFSRTELLIGTEAMERLRHAHVAVFGIGGVGGYVTEALARAGIGHFDLIDNDTVSLSNLNRQIIAARSTVGRLKTEVMRERILDINPEAQVRTWQCFYLPENAHLFDFSEYSYVVDAVDTVTAKIAIIMRAKEAGIPVISCMGAGNKIDPSQFRVADIYETKVCPLARIMRKEMKKRGVKDLKVVYSPELPRKPIRAAENEDPGSAGENTRVSAAGDGSLSPVSPTAGSGPDRTVPLHKKAGRRDTPGSISFVPPAAGLMAAGEVIRHLAGLT